MSFGVPTSFGQFQTSKPMFGQSSSQSLFGVSTGTNTDASTFAGSTSSGFGVFGQVQTSIPMFGQSSSSAGQTWFGVAINNNNSSSMNNSPFVGSTSSSFGIGAGIWQTTGSTTMDISEHNSFADKIASISATPVNKSHEELRSKDYELNIKGSRRSPYAATRDEEGIKGTKQPIIIHSISAMPIYKDKSHEELRFKDYEERIKGVQTPWGNKASEPSGVPVNIHSHPQRSHPSPFTPFNTPSTNPFSPSTNTFALQPQTPATTTTPTPFTSPSPLSPQNNPFTNTKPFSPFTILFVPQAQTPTTTTTPTLYASPDPFTLQNNPFTTPTTNNPFFPSTRPFAPISQTPTTTITPTPFTSPSPLSPHNNPFTTPTNPFSSSTNPFSPQPQIPATTTTLTPFTSPSPLLPHNNPFTTPTPTNPFSPSTRPFAPISQTPTTTITPTPFTSPSPLSPHNNSFTTPTPTNPFSPSTNPFSPQPQIPATTTTPTPFTSPSPLPPHNNPFTTPTPTNPFSPSTNPFSPQPQIPATTTTPTPSTSPRPFSPQPFTTPNNSVIRSSHPGQTCTTIPSQGPSYLMEPTLVADPFGLRSAVNTSIIQPEAVTSTPRGISSLPVKNNSALVRMSSSYRIRHLSTRRISLPAHRYNSENSGSKVPFFGDKEYRPCLVTPFLPRENPRAWVINDLSEQKHAPSDTYNKEGETCEDKAGTKSCLQENENSVKVNDTSLQGKLRLADDTLVSSLMPKLPCGGEYYTQPSIKELEAKERAEPGFCSRVKNFVVGRKDKGSIKFVGETDIRHLDLESIVQFNDREIIVYKDDEKKPPIGQGLNLPAEVTLLNVKFLSKTSGKQFSDGHQVHKLETMLMKKANEQGAEFVSYNPVRGEWKIRVQHF